MISFQRKMSLRKQAGGTVAARRKTEALARTGQVSRSTVRVGDDDFALDQVLLSAVDEAVAGEARDSNIAFLDESDVDSFDTVIDAGDAADVDSMLDAQDSDPDLIDEFEASAAADEDAHQADMTAIGANLVVTEALDAAEGAAELALEAKVTADGRNRIYAQAINPVASPDFPFVSGDLWYRTEVVGGVTRFVEVFMWNGTEWKPYQMVASSLLVPGSVGSVLIENGGITGPKIAGDAIDGKTITGATIRTAAVGRRFVMSGYSLDGYDESGIKRVTMYPSSVGLRLDSNDVAKYGTLNGDAFALNNFRTGQYDRAGFAALANRLHMTNIYPDPGGDPAKQGFVALEGRAGWPSDDMTADFTVTAREPGLGSAGGEQDVRLYASSTESFIEIYAPGGNAKIARAKGGTETVYTGPTFSFQAPVKFQGDTDWVSATSLGFFGSGWGHYTDSTYSGLQVRVKAGVLYFSGAFAKTSDWAASETIFTFNTGYRPGAPIQAFARYTVTGNIQSHLVVAMPDGRLIAGTASASTGSANLRIATSGDFPL